MPDSAFILKQRILTGITTTGTPHLGNYVGAIRAAVAHSHNDEVESFYFLADYHALVKCRDAEVLAQSVRELAASWVALGLDTDKAVFYRQSDVPEITELAWILASLTAKGLMNRAHAYKAATDKNLHDGDDVDHAVTMGLYSYPLLMAADILIFNAQRVPVGPDQVQHIEMARDIAQRFNHHYGEHFALPEAELPSVVSVLNGLDGRKMSKSYNNTIPLFCSSKKLRQLVMKIKTNSMPMDAPKPTEGCTLFGFYSAFATEEQTRSMAQRYEKGIAWGEVKEELFQVIDNFLCQPRERHAQISRDYRYLDEVLANGAMRARQYAKPMLEAVRQAVGIRHLYQTTS